MVENPDFTFTHGSAALWSIVEMNLGVLCNCLAVMKPFVRRHMPYLMSASANTGATDGSYGKRSKPNGKGWGHSYQLHSVGKGKMDRDATDRDSDSGSGHGTSGGLEDGAKNKDILVDHQFTIEYDQRAKGGENPSKGDSTDSILKTLPSDEHSGQILHGPLMVASLPSWIGTTQGRDYTANYHKGKLVSLTFVMLRDSGLRIELLLT